MNRCSFYSCGSEGKLDNGTYLKELLVYCRILQWCSARGSTWDTLTGAIINLTDPDVP